MLLIKLVSCCRIIKRTTLTPHVVDMEKTCLLLSLQMPVPGVTSCKPIYWWHFWMSSQQITENRPVIWYSRDEFTKQCVSWKIHCRFRHDMLCIFSDSEGKKGWEKLPQPYPKRHGSDHEYNCSPRNLHAAPASPSASRRGGCAHAVRALPLERSNKQYMHNAKSRSVV